MKSLIVVLLSAFIFVGTVSAACTLTTDCGTTTYTQSNITTTSSNGVVTVTSGGAVIDQFNCQTSTTIVDCSGANGTNSTNTNTGGQPNNGGQPVNICDYIPAFLAPLFGC